MRSIKGFNMKTVLITIMLVLLALTSVDAAVLKQRGDTAANWTSNDPTLAAREVGWETDTGKSKLGDGTTAWTSLGYATVNPAGLAAAQAQSLAVADLSDATTPSVLTTAETTSRIISNYKSTGADHVFTLPTAHIYGQVIFVIGDEFEVDVEPPSGTALYLNGTEMASDENIVNVADTLGEQMVCFTANLNGTLRWMCESKYTNFAEATP